MNRSVYATVRGAKSLDKWLLISEEILALRLTLTLGLQHGYHVLQPRKPFGFETRLLTIKKSGQTLILMMTTDYFRNHGQGLTFTPGLYFKYINRHIIYSANNISVFPPGTIHAVYTEKDSVFCGGHFLTPQIMNRFLRVLGQTESDLSRTNDSKGVDFFQILENFMIESLGSSTPELTRSQLHKYVLALENYLQLTPPAKSSNWDEQAHLNRRVNFQKKAEQKKWVAKLKEKAHSMGWYIGYD